MPRTFVILTLATLIAACGGNDSKTDPNAKQGPQGDLAPVLIKRLPDNPKVTINLKHADGSNFDDAAVILYDNLPENISEYVVQGITDLNGNVSFSVPAGTYQLDISHSDEPRLAAYTGEFTVGQQASQTFNFQAEQRSFSVDSGAAMKDVNLALYQRHDDGSLSTAFESLFDGLNGATGASVTVELLPGNYDTLAWGHEINDARTATVASAVFAATAGATESANIDISTPGIAVTLVLQDTDGKGNAAFSASAFDKSNFRELWHDNADVGGNAIIRLGGATDLVVVIYGVDGKAAGMVDYGMVTADQRNTYRLHTISGAIVSPEGSALAGGNGGYVKLRPAGTLADAMLAQGIAVENSPIKPAADTGTYTVDLFNGDYKLSAAAVRGLPSVTEADLKVNNADLSAQNVSVAAGGVIRGAIFNESGAAVGNALVSVVNADGAGAGIVGAISTDDNGVYAVAVPFGTYNVHIQGARHDAIVVSADNKDVALNLRQYQLTGQVTDAAGNALAATVAVEPGGSYSGSDDNGVFTLNVIEGVNNVCFYPVNRPTLSSSCDYEVMVDDASVAAYRQ